MEIIAKIQRTNRLGEVTYLAKIKDAAGVFIPYIEWKLINLPTIYENIA